MSGYQVTGTGSDGKPVTVELTKEELFQIFAEVTTKLGKKFLRERLQEQEDQIQLSEQSQQDMVPDPLERKDFQIHIIQKIITFTSLKQILCLHYLRAVLSMLWVVNTDIHMVRLFN